MGVITGLAAIKQHVENSQGGNDLKWLKLKAGESVKVTFLQEIDPDSPNYNEDAGLVIISPEHTNPGEGMFKHKAICTADEGACLPCELYERGEKGWRVKGRLYANVLVDDGKQEPYVAILSQGLSGKSITPSLAAFAEDNGTITGYQFRISRQGDAMKTEYSLTVIMNSAGVDPSDYELFPLDKVVVKHVPYDEQAEFYQVAQTSEASEGFTW